MSLFLISSLVFIIIAYNLLQRFRYKLPPGPNRWPVIGNIYDVKPVRFRCFFEWAQIYGPIFSIKLGPMLHVIVSNAELAKQVLKEHDQNLADRFRKATGKYTKDAQDLIWTDYGPHFVKVRKVTNLGLFNPKKIETLRPIREDEATALIESIFKDCTIASATNLGNTINIRKRVGIWSFNNISRITFGKRFTDSNGELDQVGQDLRDILHGRKKIIRKKSVLVENIAWLHQLMSFFDKDTEENDMLGAKLDQYLKQFIEEYNEAKSNNTAVATQHFIDSLLSLKDEHDLQEKAMLGLLWDMIVAGVDTAAISVEWSLAELIRNPRIQKKAQEELDRVIGSDRVMTELDFANLPYLQAIAKESLRIHPPTPLMLPHKAKTHVKIGGYDIPKGTVVHVSAWALGRDPNVWRDPNEFRPERFFEEDIDMRGHDFRLLPFGAGRRICPGAQLGTILVTSMLGHLLHHFDWKPPNGVKAEEIDMRESPGVVTYMKTPLQAIAIPRLPSNLYKRLPVDM